MDRYALCIYRRTGVSPEIIASSDKLQTGTIYIGRWDITEAALASFRKRGGIHRSVVEHTSVLAKAVA